MGDGLRTFWFPALTFGLVGFVSGRYGRAITRFVEQALEYERGSRTRQPRSPLRSIDGGRQSTTVRVLPRRAFYDQDQGDAS